MLRRPLPRHGGPLSSNLGRLDERPPRITACRLEVSSEGAKRYRNPLGHAAAAILEGLEPRA